LFRGTLWVELALIPSDCEGYPSKLVLGAALKAIHLVRDWSHCKASKRLAMLPTMDTKYSEEKVASAEHSLFVMESRMVMLYRLLIIRILGEESVAESIEVQERVCLPLLANLWVGWDRTVVITKRYLSYLPKGTFNLFSLTQMT
jgi:hypothetical protein